MAAGGKIVFGFKKKPELVQQESTVASLLFAGPRTGIDGGDSWRELWEEANEPENELAWDAFLAGDGAEKSEVAWLLNT